MGTTPRAKSDADLYVPRIPLGWASRAACLSGKALQVALVIWRKTVMLKTMTVSLTNKPLIDFGVMDDQTKRRALDALEEAGLIEIERKPGCSPIVTIKLDEGEFWPAVRRIRA